jgi:Fe-S cluster assembly protein SufD
VNDTAIPLTAGATVPGPEPTRGARLDALAALSAAGWPTRRREQWRYTDLEPLAADSFELASAPPDKATLEVVRRLLTELTFGESSRQLVLLDGQRVAGLGASALEGVDLAAPEEHWSEFVRLFAKPIAATQHPLAALNTAFGHRGLWLKLRAGAVLPAPIHLIVIGSRSRLASQPRIVIEAEPGAEATFVQHFVDCGSADARGDDARDDEAQGWTNCVTQLKQAEGSRIALHRIQRHGGGAVHTSLLTAELAPRASLTAGYFDLGARLVRNDIAVTLAGTDARTDLFGLFLAGAGQHVDDHTLIRHAAGATVSTENFRGIIGAHGRGVFNGKVIVDPNCQRIDARQNNDNLLLGDHAEIDAKPELEIYANDVKCSHGSTVGELDAEQLFYLRARGLDMVSARRVLTTAFATAVVEQIADERLRDEVLGLVTARLAALTE